jgi:pimeloyl-ACP methyl ester carboxylesterase
MAAVSPVGPSMPDALERHRDTSAGRMRSRTVGERRTGVPEVVVVQGMAVADYLMPAVAELGRWTRAHLVELPDYAGSGEAVRPLDVTGYGEAVAEWVAGAELGPVVLVGHSSGTQVAARAGAAADGVVGVVLASPTVAEVVDKVRAAGEEHCGRVAGHGTYGRGGVAGDLVREWLHRAPPASSTAGVMCA